MTDMRDHSLDALRGLTVVLMVLVNVQGSDADAFTLLRHAAWDGLTLADLVFPWFLVIVGLSVPLALDRARHRSPWPAIIRRAVMLIGIGIVLGWLIRPTFDTDQIRVAGILQRIAIVYFACAAVVLARPGWRLAATLASLILILHTWLLLAVAAPGDALPSLAAGEGISGWIDQQYLPGRVHRGTWDPEGIVSTLPAIASGLIGVAVRRWLTAARPGRDWWLWPLATALIASGLLSTAILPINKALWTASFTLVTAGSLIALWMVLRQLWPSIGNSRIARWLVLLGQTALTLYVIHMLLIALLVRHGPGGSTVWALLYAPIAATGLWPPVAALLFAIIATAVSTAPLRALQRRGWLIKA